MIVSPKQLRRTAFVITFAALSAALPAAAAEPVSPCEGDDAYHLLDFWVGSWDVYVGDRLVGANRIEKILGGCALLENWTAAGGSEGKSLFYYVPASETWKQVWVTENPSAPGGVKEKTLVPADESESVRFRGDVLLPGGGTYVDRTTLSPLTGGRVRQVIETSSDGGASWTVRFDAVYVPRTSGGTEEGAQ